MNDHSTLSRFPRAQRGFTLVELSIVLVIIGLLIGGILVGQSLISSAKINAQVSQLQQFDAGVMVFKSQYKYLPGDAPAFGGDGDGKLEEFTDNVVFAFACEIANFWNGVNSQEYSASTCASGGNQAIVTGTLKNVPASKIGSANSFFIASTLSSDGKNIDSANFPSYYAILSGVQVQVLGPYGGFHFTTTSSSNSSVRPVDLLALDKKWMMVPPTQAV